MSGKEFIGEVEVEEEEGQVWSRYYAKCNAKPLDGFKPVTGCGLCFQKLSLATERLERKQG